MHVLGINAYHAGASACLLRDGVLIAAVEEERLNRQKYWAGFPVLAIRKCLELGGVRAQDVEHIAIHIQHPAFAIRWFHMFRQGPRRSFPITER